jgi:drug/metabolite transporter (DMT)-like permease
VTPPVKGSLSRGIGFTALGFAVLLFSINGTVSKWVLTHGFDAARLAEVRVTAAFGILLVFALFIARSDLKLKRREILPMLAYGIIGIGMTQYLYFVGISRLPIGVALVIEFTSPVMVALYARFVQHHEIRPIVWVALALVMVGLVLVTQAWDGFSLDLIGTLAAFGAALALCVYFIGGEYYVAKRQPIATATLSMGAASIMWAIVLPWFTFPFEDFSKTSSAGSHELPLWVAVIWIVVLGTAVPFMLEFTALRRVSARQAAIIGTLEPVVAALIAFLVLGEVLTWAQGLGGLIVLGGVILAESASSDAAPPMPVGQ